VTALLAARVVVHRGALAASLGRINQDPMVTRPRCEPKSGVHDAALG
jgi:hypothetical protein